MLDLECTCLRDRGGGLRGDDCPNPVFVKGFGAKSTCEGGESGCAEVYGTLRVGG
jgi:hypothetical protein